MQTPATPNSPSFPAPRTRRSSRSSRNFASKQGVTCTFKYEGSLDIGLALQRPQGLTQDAVWPASSVWVDLFDTGRKVRNLTSIAQMPVILGVRKSKAAELGWIGKDVFMKDILAAVKERPAEVPDDLGDAVQFRRQRLSRRCCPARSAARR